MIFIIWSCFNPLKKETRRWIVSEDLWRSFKTVPQDQVWRDDSRQHLYAGIDQHMLPSTVAALAK